MNEFLKRLIALSPNSEKIKADAITQLANDLRLSDATVLSQLAAMQAAGWIVCLWGQDVSVTAAGRAHTAGPESFSNSFNFDNCSGPFNLSNFQNRYTGIPADEIVKVLEALRQAFPTIPPNALPEAQKAEAALQEAADIAQKTPSASRRIVETLRRAEQVLTGMKYLGGGVTAVTNMVHSLLTKLPPLF